MRRNKKNSRRLIVMVVLLAILSLAGLSLIKVGNASADGTGAIDGTSMSETAKAEAALADAKPVTADSEPGVYSAVGKMLAALGVVILVAYGALYVLRRMMGKRYGGGAGSGALEVLQTTHVGPHKTISLVRVGQRSVLVGVTDQQIATLTELDIQETEEIVMAAERPESNDGFASLLAAAADRLKTVGLKKPAVLETS